MQGGGGEGRLLDLASFLLLVPSYFFFLLFSSTHLHFNFNVSFRSLLSPEFPSRRHKPAASVAFFLSLVSVSVFIDVMYQSSSLSVSFPVFFFLYLSFRLFLVSFHRLLVFFLPFVLLICFIVAIYCIVSLFYAIVFLNVGEDDA